MPRTINTKESEESQTAATTSRTKDESNRNSDIITKKFFLPNHDCTANNKVKLKFKCLWRFYSNDARLSLHELKKYSLRCHETEVHDPPCENKIKPEWIAENIFFSFRSPFSWNLLFCSPDPKLSHSWKAFKTDETSFLFNFFSIIFIFPHYRVAYFSERHWSEKIFHMAFIRLFWDFNEWKSEKEKFSRGKIFYAYAWAEVCVWGLFLLKM